MTWAALFKSDVVRSVAAPATSLLGSALLIAGSEVGVMEMPPGSNRGPKVDLYLASVGLKANAGSFPWCAAFVYWCFREASKNLGVTNPAIKTAGALMCGTWPGPKGFGVLRAPKRPTGHRPCSRVCSSYSLREADTGTSASSKVSQA